MRRAMIAVKPIAYVRSTLPRIRSILNS